MDIARMIARSVKYCRGLYINTTERGIRVGIIDGKIVTRGRGGGGGHGRSVFCGVKIKKRSRLSVIHLWRDESSDYRSVNNVLEGIR